MVEARNQETPNPSVSERTRQYAPVVIAGGLPMLLYLVYVAHYSVNVPYADDWYMIPVVHSALHGHLNASQLWFQYGDSRLFVSSLLFVLFAFVDHLNLQSVLLFSAAVFSVTYLMLLLVLRAYLGRRLTALSVLAVGLVWFSLCDAQNALWSFQLSWYLVVFCLIATIYLLSLPHRCRNVVVGLAIVAAIAGSYSIVQGFLLWPVGLLCIGWINHRSRRMYLELATWISAAATTTAIYASGYRTANPECPPHSSQCSTSFVLLHPVGLLRYLLALVGNVLPTSFGSFHPDDAFHELLGGIIMAGAVYVVVQSIRNRRSRSVPLPLLLIFFGASFDLMIILGREFEGLATAATSRYTMPNLLILVGIVTFSLAHLRSPSAPSAPNPKMGLRTTSILLAAVLTTLLAAQCITSTTFGIADGSASRQAFETDAQVVVNLHRTPISTEECDAALAVLPPWPPASALWRLDSARHDIAEDQLSVFEPSTKQFFRHEGTPSKRAVVSAGEFSAVRRLWLRQCP
jgi:hypothetical protein